jgi:hypothetical protein
MLLRQRKSAGNDHKSYRVYRNNASFVAIESAAIPIPAYRFNSSGVPFKDLWKSLNINKTELKETYFEGIAP